jgi:DNA-binding NtrC family response regulator
MANILVVDDEMGIRELLSEILGDEGHVVATAENAQQARERRVRAARRIWCCSISGCRTPTA